MAFAELVDWMNTHSTPRSIWFVKRLSANDTGANQTRQEGIYIPKPLAFEVFPELNQPTVKNPHIEFPAYIDSHAGVQRLTIIWYNSKFYENPKNGWDEPRFTNLGGRNSALLDPENIGSLAVFIFEPDAEGHQNCYIWVCEHETESDLVEERLGWVKLGMWTRWTLQDTRVVPR
jgi:hypothetical protein